MKYDIVIADPAKNITVFVLDQVQDRAAAVKALMADPSLAAEQVGFVIPPPGGSDRPWRLEMMGGEFCGNAARSFGLYVARRTGLTGKQRVLIEISGAAGPLAVQVDPGAGLAEVTIPAPVAEETLEFNGADLPIYLFEGITHVIAPDIAPDEDVFYTIKELVERKFAGQRQRESALGVLFWDSAAALMRPAVYVYGSRTLMFESSCGSGTAAMGCWLSREKPEDDEAIPIVQPGGIIEARVIRKGGAVIGISIGGTVKLYYPD
ncbi:conserved hypothetical protein [Treponema primitia ZAS-2]|uniref:Diaminopimelate epimerase n=1 Tax=Treponema primitia (strain ATCC BAA-887 / DSM 12427 / ZAS-2) TaxID=545694 RepID=F5YI44_TREPZ|nr:hypothetical protein [Treponema primitia]AEF84735.1 conserved hypothetical protein [Treponema primitia ZAS-2]